MESPCCVTEQTLPKNTASDKSEAVCMPCSTKFNINNLADISVHDLIKSNTSREPDNVVSNPTREDFFDNCACYNRNSLNNLAISTNSLFIMHFKIRSLQKNFDSLAYYFLELERPPDVITILKTKIIENALYLKINLHGYSFLHCDSKIKAVGEAFYIKESLLFSRRNNIKVEFQLVNVIEIKTNRGPVVVGVVCRHPTNSTCDCEKFSENFFKIFYETNFEKFPFYFLKILILT